jgi:hypothetical protein
MTTAGGDPQANHTMLKMHIWRKGVTLTRLLSALEEGERVAM